MRISCHLLALLQMTGDASDLLSPTQVDHLITLSYCNSLVYIVVVCSFCLSTYKLITVIVKKHKWFQKQNWKSNYLVVFAVKKYWAYQRQRVTEKNQTSKYLEGTFCYQRKKVGLPAAEEHSHHPGSAAGLSGGRCSTADCPPGPLQSGAQHQQPRPCQSCCTACAQQQLVHCN